MKVSRIFGLACLVLLCVPTVSDAQSQPAASPVVDQACPGLRYGALAFATLGDLPEGIVLRSGSTEITSAKLDEEIAKAPEAIRNELKKNLFFMLDQFATRGIFLEVAKKEATDANKDISSKTDQQILGDYARGIVEKVEVTDDEIAKFYGENQASSGGATLEQMKNQIREFLLSQKRQDTMAEHIRTLGQRVPIVVSAAWTKEQDAIAKDNPADKARASGKPTLLEFGSEGCRPCAMMAPIIEELRKKYEGKVNVVFTNTRENKILSARYRVEAIPVQAFFDKDGKEVFRHVGFFAQAEIEKKFADMGIQ